MPALLLCACSSAGGTATGSSLGDSVAGAAAGTASTVGGTSGSGAGGAMVTVAGGGGTPGVPAASGAGPNAGGPSVPVGGNSGATAGAATSGGSSVGGQSEAGGSAGMAPESMGGATVGGSSGSGGQETAGVGPGGSGGDTALGPADFLGALDGYLYTGECNGGSASFECPLSDCTGNVFMETAEFIAAGDGDTLYDVTLHVWGVTELRSDYSGGERRQGESSNAMSADDFFYAGGSYTAGAGYNVYGLRVVPAVADVPNADDGGNNYFLNARDSSGEAHEVWKLDYEVTIPIAGGGTVSFTAYDPNCLQIMNNSETARPSGTGPNGSIVISEVDSADPPPVDFVQPLATQGRQGQWVFVDVVDVRPR